MIKAIKEEAAHMSEVHQKEERKKKHKPDVLASRREVVDLVYKHIDEVEQFEKKRFNDRAGVDRLALLTRTDENKTSTIGGLTGTAATSGNSYTSSALPDIDVEEDMKNIKSKNKQIV
jgi:hypothetical protein